MKLSGKRPPLFSDKCDRLFLGVAELHATTIDLHRIPADMPHWTVLLQHLAAREFLRAALVETFDCSDQIRAPLSLLISPNGLADKNGPVDPHCLTCTSTSFTNKRNGELDVREYDTARAFIG